jgi:uncharacterized protein (DUF488 family)
MQAFDLLTIGHSNIAVERFIGMLRAAGADTIADVRSTPFSRRFPWFSGKNLAVRLEQEGMSYAAFGDTLGGRPRDAALYCDGIADYEAMAKQEDFRAGLDRLLALAAERRVCLMCAEREPLDCHRCLLVARALAARGRTIGHILHDGTIEPHAATEKRLLAFTATADLFTPDLFTPGQSDRLAAAYRDRARAVAYRAETSRAKTVKAVTATATKAAGRR